MTNHHNQIGDAAAEQETYRNGMSWTGVILTLAFLALVVMGGAVLSL